MSKKTNQRKKEIDSSLAYLLSKKANTYEKGFLWGVFTGMIGAAIIIYILM